MNRSHDPERYREEAARFREMAVAATDSNELRRSYLAPAVHYKRLAVVLEKVLVESKSMRRDRFSRPARPLTPPGRHARPVARRHEQPMGFGG